MSEMKYEIKKDGGTYSVFYGRGYPYSDFLAHMCMTMRGAKRVIRRHKRKVARGEITSGVGTKNPYNIIYTEELLSRQDVEARIRDLERELGIVP